MFVAGWRHALRSEWPFIIIIIITLSRLEPMWPVHHPSRGPPNSSLFPAYLYLPPLHSSCSCISHCTLHQYPIGAQADVCVVGVAVGHCFR